MFVGHGDAQQPRLSHFGKDRGVGRFVQIGVLDARGQPLGGKGGRAVADHPLFLGQLILKQKRVGP